MLVTSDLIGFPAAVAEPICERIREKTGLKRAQILINSAHIHTGPVLSLDRPFLHAFRLMFHHPSDGRKMEFESPLPHDLQSVLDQILPDDYE